jgi:tetratricopeptide (TPR) repeat protein
MAKKAIKIRPDNGAYLDTIGWIYYKLSKFNLALEYIKRSLEQRENSPVVIEHLGDVYLKLGDKKQAMHYWKRSLEVDDSNIELKRKVEKLSL